MKRAMQKKRKEQFILLTVSFIIILSVSLIFGAFFVSANVNHFFTLLGKMFFTPYGKDFFTSLSKQIFTS